MFIDLYHVHHWRFNFKESKFVKELSDVRDDLSTDIENIANPVV